MMHYKLRIVDVNVFLWWRSGSGHVGEVVWLLYAYIDLLTTGGGVAEWIYNELRSVCEMRFNFQDKAAPADTASALASKMLVGLGFWGFGFGVLG